MTNTNTVPRSVTSSFHIICLWLACFLQSSTADHPSIGPKTDTSDTNKPYYHSSGYYSYDSSSSSSSSSDDGGSSDDALSSQAVLPIIFGSLFVLMFCSVLVCCFMTDRFRYNQFYKDVAKARLEIIKDATTTAEKLKSEDNNNEAAGTKDQPQTPVINFAVGKFSATYLPQQQDSIHHDNNKVPTIDSTENTGEHEESSGSIWFHHLIDSTGAREDPSSAASSAAAADHNDIDGDHSDKTATATNNPDGDGEATDCTANQSPVTSDNGKSTPTKTIAADKTDDEAVRSTKKAGDSPEGDAAAAASNTKRRLSSSSKATRKPTSTTATSSPAITITGVGKDRDGPYTIKTGKLSPYTGKCYWLEESVVRKHSPNQKKTRVLVTGIFQRDMESGVVKFTGQWQSSFGTRGTYAHFDIVPTNKQAKA